MKKTIITILCLMLAVSFIYTNSANEDLISGANSGDIEQVKNALENGADVNFIDRYSWTALMRASWIGNINIVKLLIGKDADINIKNVDGNTALMIAKMQGHHNIENILKNYTREQAQNQIQNDNTNRNEQNNTGDRPTQPNNTQGHNAPSDREIEEFGEKIYKEEIGSYLVSVVNPAFIGDHRLWWGLKKGMTEKREAGGIVSWTFYDKYVIFRDGNRASIKEIREWKRNNGNIVNCLFFKNGLIKTYIYSNYPRLGYISLFLYEKEENNWVYIETLIVRK